MPRDSRTDEIAAIEAELLNLHRQLRQVNMRPYAAAHRRVAQLRGSASLYACVDCTARAAHWSYDNRDPNEKSLSCGTMIYSNDPAHYEPRCSLCHKQYDNREASLRELLRHDIDFVLEQLAVRPTLARHFINVHLRDFDPGLLLVLRQQIRLDVVS